MDRPSSLAEAIAYFSDLDVATEYVAGLRWPDGWACPHCGGRDYSYLSTRRLWKCKLCKKQSSIKVGTIFEGSALGLDKWLPAIWLVANPREGVDARELAREIGTTERSAWIMLQRIREAAPAEVASPAVAVEQGEASHYAHPSRFEPRPSVLIAFVLGVFALGVAVGRLTRRVR